MFNRSERLAEIAGAGLMPTSPYNLAREGCGHGMPAAMRVKHQRPTSWRKTRIIQRIECCFRKNDSIESTLPTRLKR